MKKWKLSAAIVFAVSTLTLAACSDASDASDPAASYTDASADIGYEAEMAAAEMADAQTADAGGSAIPQLADIGVNVPKLSYTYEYRWRMAAEEIGSLQRRHASLCEQQGMGACQILGMTKTGEEADEVQGVLEMAVASRQARAFGALLEDEAQDAGAEQIAAEIASEELSKRIVDTEARLRARTELRDRLMTALAAQRGTVEEMVEAERSVARVNEEIDQARSWLTEMEGRVAYSRITVRYETGVPITNDFLTPVQSAVGALGSILGFMFAGLILIGSVVLPIGLIVWGIGKAGRRMAQGSDLSAETPA